MPLPERIVCLTEETTELLYLLEESDRIVGISAYTVRPPQAKKEKPVVSAFIGGSVSKILALNPDLVLGFSDVQADYAASLIRANLPVFIFNQRTLQEILDAMLLIGHMVGAGEKAQQLVHQWGKALDDARDRANQRSHRPKVYFEEWDEPMISGIEWVRELIECAGGECVFPEAKGPKAQDRTITVDDVVEAAPEVIIASWCGKPFDESALRNRPGFETIPACIEGRVHEMDSGIILQPGPALFLDGLELLERLIHPQEFV